MWPVAIVKSLVGFAQPHLLGERQGALFDEIGVAEGLTTLFRCHLFQHIEPLAQHLCRIDRRDETPNQLLNAQLVGERERLSVRHPAARTQAQGGPQLEEAALTVYDTHCRDREPDDGPWLVLSRLSKLSGSIRQ